MLDLSSRQGLVQPFQALAERSRAVCHPNSVEELETFMGEDPKKTGLDGKRIALNEEHEVPGGPGAEEHGRRVARGGEGRWQLGGEGARVPSEELIRAAASRSH
jgi:hypothetical protein